MCIVPLPSTPSNHRKIEFLGFQIEFLDFWNEFLVFFFMISWFLSSFWRKFRFFRHFYPKIMEFLVKNRVFKDFEIEFLPKIEFFDFWPNRVFVKSHKKSLFPSIRGVMFFLKWWMLNLTHPQAALSELWMQQSVVTNLKLVSVSSHIRPQKWVW